MRFGIVFIHKMHIIRCNDFYAVLTCQLDQDFIDFHLLWISALVGIWGMRFVTLQFQIVIIAKKVLEP